MPTRVLTQSNPVKSSKNNSLHLDFTSIKDYRKEQKDDISPQAAKATNSATTEKTKELNRSSTHAFAINTKIPKRSSMSPQAFQLATENRNMMSRIDVAAFTHILEWSRSAELVKIQMKIEDEIMITNLNCCCRLCFSTFCPGFTCCDHSTLAVDKKIHNNINDYNFVRQVEAKYRCCCCCCCCRCPLNLATSLCIWENIPLGVIKLRLILLGQLCAQLLTVIFQWIFLLAVLQMDTDDTADTNSEPVIKVSNSVKYATIATFILPEIVHVVWMVYTPGYNLRSSQRMSKQIVYSMLAQFFVRPFYDLAWSFRWTGLMPYVSLQNEGDLVTDSGMHERYIIWAGLAVSLREMPLNIIKAYILAEYWIFWGNHLHSLDDTSDVLTTLNTTFNIAADGGELKECASFAFNEWSVLFSMGLGLLVSAMTLSDLVERQVPYGAFPNRFSIVLRGEATSFLWTVTLLCTFFVDLLLRFAVVIPVTFAAGLNQGLCVMLGWFAQSSILVWMILSESESKQSLEKKESMHIEERKKKRRKSYDSGYMLETLAMRSTQARCCCGLCNSTLCGTVVETAPFIFWSMWVDLPMRLKWLRLNSGKIDKKKKTMLPPSLRYFLLSNFGTLIIVFVVFYYNYSSLYDAWERGKVRCTKIIPSPCVEILPFDISATSCPNDFEQAFKQVDKQQRPSVELNSSWIFGCCLNVTTNKPCKRICMPEIYDRGNHLNIEIFRYGYLQHEDKESLRMIVIVCLILKIFLCFCISQQFYCVRRNNRGKLCCVTSESIDTTESTLEQKDSVYATATESSDNVVHNKSKVSGSFGVLNRDLRLQRMARLNRHNWHSTLRSRDIQLMLRVSRMMPNVRSFRKNENLDMRVVQIARSMLGVANPVIEKEMSKMGEESTIIDEELSIEP